MKAMALLASLALLLASCATTTKPRLVTRTGGVTLAKAQGVTVSAFKIAVIPDVWRVLVSNTARHERCVRIGFNVTGAKWVSAYHKPLRVAPGMVIDLGSYTQEVDDFMGFDNLPQYQFRLRELVVGRCENA